MPSLSGQWIGETADKEAEIILDLDECPLGVKGSGRVFFSNGSPGAICQFELPDFPVQHTISVGLSWLAPNGAIVLGQKDLDEHFSQYRFSESAEISFKKDHQDLIFSWLTPIGVKGSARLSRADMKSESKINSENLTWSEFKDRALRFTAGDMIFRGQPAPYRLRTAFHRTYRKDLIAYATQDIPYVHRQLTARTNHLFDLTKPPENGAFYNLLQHHGFPTPLLDWTYSPFVAAFFAYRRRNSEKDGNRKVRIVAFDKIGWTKAFNQLEVLNFIKPHFSILEALAIENPRAIPQQALSSLTNLDDIEGYIFKKEAELGQRFLVAYDLEADDRPKVMAELSLMGITAGSLFPGLDGACEELMGRFFHHQVPAVSGD